MSTKFSQTDGQTKGKGGPIVDFDFHVWEYAKMHKDKNAANSYNCCFKHTTAGILNCPVSSRNIPAFTNRKQRRGSVASKVLPYASASDLSERPLLRLYKLPSDFDMQLNLNFRSLGVVGFVLVTNRMPYNERVASNTLIVEAQKNRSYRYSKKLQISQICQNTIDTMMTFDYRERPDIQQVINFHFFIPVFPASDSISKVRSPSPEHSIRIIAAKDNVIH